MCDSINKISVLFVPLQIEVTTDKNTDEAYKVKEVMRKCGTDVIRKQLAQYVKELRESKNPESDRKCQ